MHSTVSALLDEVSTSSGVKGVLARVERLGEQGDFETLVALAAGLEARQESTPSEERWRLHSVSDRVEEVLARNTRLESALALLELARQPRDSSFQGRHSSSRRARDFAHLLASHRSAATFVELLARRQGHEDLTELFACTVQELVLRGVALDKEPLVRELWATLADQEHPLAVLPLTRMPWEAALGREPGVDDLASAVGSLSAAMSRASGEDDEDEMTTPNVKLVVRDEPVPHALAAVISGRGDDGFPSQVEQRVLKLRPALPLAPPDSITSLLVDLDLELLRGDSPVDCERTNPDELVPELFSLAALGARGWQGAEGAAYGRLALWRTLAGLSGFDAPLEAAALSARLKLCRWYRFQVPPHQSMGGATRLGVACLRPGGTSLALLAVRDEPEAP
ncbi:DUF6183 family protein [Myxococcus eversor]|uniref:DUF6183 family protein n=1 Tax=Myxococcus eversor TaxID=2709661 RepID=UPI0013D6385E|nr:DUF6183 family protein [Myxococcus eversor]